MTKKLIAILLMLVMAATGASAFSDMNIDERYYDEISYLCERGVFTTFEDGSFNPDSYMTRAEFAVVVCRITNTPKSTMPSEVADVEGHWAEEYINAVTQNAMMGERRANLFCPNEYITNWQAVKAIVDITKQMPPIKQHPFIYPERYLETAESLGIEYFSEDEVFLTRRMAVHMIYTAFDIPVLKNYYGKSSGTFRDFTESSYKFKDEAIGYLCSVELGKDVRDIKPIDLKNIREINAYNLPEGMYIESLKDVVYMSSLDNVILTNQKIQDVSPLSRIKDEKGEYITSFGVIDLYNNPAKDVSSLIGVKTETPMSFPYEKNDNKKYFITIEQYVEMMNVVLGVTENEAYKDESIERKLQNAHDFIVLNCSYVDDESQAIRTTYGTIVNGEAVCEGYARAFKLFCDVLGVECKLVTGNAGIAPDDTGAHAWNKLVIDGETKYVDVTWDDLDYRNWIIYDFFLLDNVSKTHHELDEEEKSTDRFSYSIGKTKDKMQVDLSFNTFRNAKKVIISFQDSPENISMTKTGEGTWCYSYTENPNDYFTVKDNGISPTEFGVEPIYSGEYRRDCTIDVITDDMTFREMYVIEYK